MTSPRVVREFNFTVDVSHIPGWLTAAEGRSLFEAARRVEIDQAIVEIGSFKGRSTLCLAAGARRGRGAWVFAVDPHLGNREHQRQFGPIDTFSAFIRNLEAAGVTDIVAGIRDTSASLAGRFSRPVGFLFVDGNHELRAVRDDLARWLPLVVDGGVVAVHDSWQIPGPHIATAIELLTSRTIRKPVFLGLQGLCQPEADGVRYRTDAHIGSRDRVKTVAAAIPYTVPWLPGDSSFTTRHSLWPRRVSARWRSFAPPPRSR